MPNVISGSSAGPFNLAINSPAVGEPVTAMSVGQFTEPLIDNDVYLYSVLNSARVLRSTTIVTSSGTGVYTVPPDTKMLKVTCVGAGGGSGHSISGSVGSGSMGGGGGGGGTIIKYYEGDNLEILKAETNISYSVGAGGTASSGFNFWAGNGGDTEFAVGVMSGAVDLYARGTGGIGGSTSNVGSTQIVVSGAAGGVGEEDAGYISNIPSILINGGSGGKRMRIKVDGSLIIESGDGGSSFFAGSVSGHVRLGDGIGATNGTAGIGPGGGASGGASSGNDTALGANGADGICIIEEYVGV